MSPTASVVGSFLQVCETEGELPFCWFCISKSLAAVLIRAGSALAGTAAIGILDNLLYLNDFLLLSVCIVLG